MPLSLSLQRRFGYGGKKHPWRRGVFRFLSGTVARRAGGGITFADDDEVLARVRADLGLPPGPRVDHYVDELRAERPLIEAFELAGTRHGRVEDASWDARLVRCRGVVALYYGLLRELRPAVVVETGTAAGSLTSFVMAALARNAHGRLISIDIPPVAGKLQMNLSVAAESVGFFIPPAYRERWTYLEGDAKRLLPRVLAEERVDVFIHDSLHTVTHMLFEYAVARALLREGGLILSDDILWNDAFASFLHANRLYGYAPFSQPGTGVVVNRFDSFEKQSGIGLADA
ncbi:MAG: class I SAM-dependent methyltransferase [Planctomycetota bacterium]|nr:MAG: class I SAM-dependent methyltransferase [Planctomycetota bacterium]